MKKKKLQSNKDPQRKKLKQSPHKSPYQLDPSDFDFLLFNFRIPPSYLSGRQLQEEINLFDAFVSNPKNAGMSLDECINAFSSEKKWIDEEDIEISECEDEKDSPEHLNHYIASAVLWGFKIQSGRKSFEDLIIKRSGPKENFSIVYSYRCLNRNCPNLGTLSQYQYDKIKISSKRCPYCRTGQLEKVKVLTNACLTWLEQYKRIQAQSPGIPITLERLQKYDEARTTLDNELVPRWKELTTDHFPTGKEIEKINYHRPCRWFSECGKTTDIVLRLA